MQAFIWTPEAAAAREAPQLGPSSCGATAVLNVLSALDWPELPAEDEVNSAVAVRLRKPDAPLPEYLLSRSEAGTDHNDLISGIGKLTGGRVRGRFFPTYPWRDVDLCSWIARWIDAGAVPVATLNLQRGVPRGQDIPDAWHHQMIYGVSEEGLFMTNPVVRTDLSTAREQLCSERVLLIRIADVVARYTDLDDLGLLSGRRWAEMSTVFTIRQAIRALRNRDYASVPPHIAVPARYRSGITVFARRNSAASVRLEKEAWPDLDANIHDLD